MAPGCVEIHPSLFPIVWIAANDLPLHEALIPLLIARSGAKLREFVRWVVHVRPPEWLTKVILSLREVAAMMPEFKPDLAPEDRLRVIEGLRKSVQAYPEVVEDIHEYYAGLVERMIARRLDRTLTEAERKTLAKRVEELDRDQLCVTVLDLPTEKLAAWLAEPSAP